MEINNSLLRKEGAKMGVYLGIIVVFLTILPMYYYVTSTSFWTVTLGTVITGFFLPLVVAFWLTFILRKRIGGYWAFKQAVTGIFVMLFVASVISTISGLVFEKVIEPDMRERYMRNMQNNTIEFMENANVDAEQIDEQMAKLDEQIEATAKSTPLDTLKGFMIYIVVAFILAMIFALISKRERPMFHNPEISIE